ncbi:MAG TPA: high light inducible protein [Synechococcales bacterium UBA10510]|nr:high light inducible protein [Synechococcales bacterium UBA10510]
MPNPDPQPQANAEPQASGKPEPLGQTQPPTTSATTNDSPAFGWSAYAERINGRFAMLGFVAVLLIEALSGDNFLHWAGLVP